MWVKKGTNQTGCGSLPVPVGRTLESSASVGTTWRDSISNVSTKVSTLRYYSIPFSMVSLYMLYVTTTGDEPLSKCLLYESHQEFPVPNLVRLFLFVHVTICHVSPLTFIISHWLRVSCFSLCDPESNQSSRPRFSSSSDLLFLTLTPYVLPPSICPLS